MWERGNYLRQFSISFSNLLFVSFTFTKRLKIRAKEWIWQHCNGVKILIILFGIDDLVPNLGPTVEVLSDIMKFGTKNK